MCAGLTEFTRIVVRGRGTSLRGTGTLKIGFNGTTSRSGGRTVTTTTYDNGGGLRDALYLVGYANLATTEGYIDSECQAAPD
jgi:hypothetical protein